MLSSVFVHWGYLFEPLTRLRGCLKTLYYFKCAVAVKSRHPHLSERCAHAWNCVWKDTNSKINAMESVYQIKRPQICQPVCFCSPSLSGSVASPSPIMPSLWLCKENGCLLRKYISAGTSTAGGRVEQGENLRQPSAAHDRKVNGKMWHRHTIMYDVS